MAPDNSSSSSPTPALPLSDFLHLLGSRGTNENVSTSQFANNGAATQQKEQSPSASPMTRLSTSNRTSTRPSTSRRYPTTSYDHTYACPAPALQVRRSMRQLSIDGEREDIAKIWEQWNAFVELLPLWLAPNMVTLLGFICILFNVGLLIVMMPDLEGPAPPWVYYSFAFGLFMYQTFDNVDGKQARRTGTSSGLGELFDHGIDSLNCTLASLLETAAMGLGTSKSGVFTALCPCLPMFFSTWETYHTHTLYLGVINGPTEGLLLACTFMILSGYYGPAIWTEPLTKLLGPRISMLGALGVSDEVLDHLSIRDLWVTVIVLSLLFTHIPFCINNVVKARRAKGLPVAPVFLEWTPMVVYTLSIGAWLYSPYSTICSENHLVMFCIIMSFVFGRMTTKMILAHLTRQPFPYWTVMLWPLVGGAVLGNLPRFGLPAVSAEVEYLYLVGYLIFSAVVYFRWAWLVTTSICKFLGINCLTIPREKQLQNKAQNQGILNGAPNGGRKVD